MLIKFLRLNIMPVPRCGITAVVQPYGGTGIMFNRFFSKDNTGYTR